MAGPVLDGIGLALGVAGLAFDLHGVLGPDPLEEKIDETNEKLDALTDAVAQLNSQVHDLGENLMHELNIIETLIPDVAIRDAVAEAETAYSALNLYKSDEDFGYTRGDVITLANSALYRVLNQIEPRLASAEPETAIGFLGALAYAAGVRAQVALELEDGAFGSDVLSSVMQRVSDAITDLHGFLVDRLTDGVKSPIVPISVPSLIGVTVHLKAWVESDYSDAITKDVTFFAGVWELDEKLAEEEAKLQAWADATSASMAASDIKSFGFDQLPKLAETFASLADGEERSGTSKNDMLEGTSGNDLMIGWAGDDQLFAFADHDVVRAGSGHDTVNGGGGNDNLLGGAGHDLINGGNGNDALVGGLGQDTLNGGNGADQLVGGNGADVLNGGNGADTLSGGAGNDRLVGGQGRDELRGGAGADLLLGNLGADTLKGNDGADTLNGGVASDLLLGGGGADTFVFSDVDSVDRVADFEGGLDRLVFATSDFASMGKGQIADGELSMGSSAATPGAEFFYDGDTLWFDADGAGGDAAFEVVRLLDAPELSASDIYIA